MEQNQKRLLCSSAQGRGGRSNELGIVLCPAHQLDSEANLTTKQTKTKILEIRASKIRKRLAFRVGAQPRGKIGGTDWAPLFVSSGDLLVAFSLSLHQRSTYSVEQTPRAPRDEDERCLFLVVVCGAMRLDASSRLLCFFYVHVYIYKLLLI